MREQSYIKNNSHQNNIRGGETKIMKKSLVVLLTLALVFTMVTPAFAASADLTVQQQFDALKASGVLSGDANGNMLAEDSTMNRQMLAKIACQLAGVAATPGVEIAAYANDYKTNVWGFTEGWAQAAYTAGLMEGFTYEDGTTSFDAAGTVSMGELLTVILRAMNVEIPTVAGPWYTGAMQAAVAQGLVPQGTSGAADATYGDLVQQTYTADAVINPVIVPTEVSVTVVDGNTIVVDFPTAVNPNATGTGMLNKANYTLNGIGLVAGDSVTKAADNKSVTITLATALSNYTAYAFVVQNITKADFVTKVPMYSTVINYLDLVRPTVVSVVSIDNVTAKVTFSEEMAGKGIVKVKDAAGVDVTANFTSSALSADAKSFTVSMTNALVLNGVNYTLEVLGSTDLSGNLLSPNPSTAIITKKVEETVAPTIVSITSPSSNSLVITYSEKVSVPGTVAIGGGAVLTISTNPVIGNATVDASGTVYSVNVPAANLGAVTADGVYNVVVSTFIDVNGNTTASQTKAVSMVKDVTGPAYVSNQILDIAGTKYLVLTFGEKAAAGSFIDTAADITTSYVDTAGILQTGSLILVGPATNAMTEYNPTGALTVDSVKIDIANQVAGTYTITIPAGLVQDDLTNSNLPKQITYSLNSTIADSTKPTATVTAFQIADNDTVTVTFSENVEMASALNLANYTVDGLNVFKTAVFNTTTKVVDLTLNENAISYAGNHAFTIANVKDLAGNTMMTNTTVQTAIENTRPVITKAELTAANVITITFSEAIAALPVATDLDVKIGSVQESELAPFAIAAHATIANAYTITLTDDITALELAAEITVKTQSGNVIADANGNAIKAQTVIVTK